MIKFLLLISILLASATSHANRMVEVEYLEKMGEHHKNGIEKSKLALSKTQNKEIKKIAKQIITEQTKVKKKLDKLRAKLYSDVIIDKTNINYKNYGLKDLENSTGHEFDNLYLELMENYFKDEIVMTANMLPGLNRKEVHKIAVKIIKNKGNYVYRLEKIKKSL